MNPLVKALNAALDKLYAALDGTPPSHLEEAPECGLCKGKGKVDRYYVCPICRGKGKTWNNN